MSNLLAIVFSTLPIKSIFFNFSRKSLPANTITQFFHLLSQFINLLVQNLHIFEILHLHQVFHTLAFITSYRSLLMILHPSSLLEYGGRSDGLVLEETVEESLRSDSTLNSGLFHI